MAGCVRIRRKSAFLLLTLIQAQEICNGELSHETQTISLENATVLEEVLDEYRTSHQQNISLREKVVFGRSRSSEISTNQSRNTRGIGDKMKNLWKKMRGKKQEWDLSREEASKMFEEYYECITKRHEEAKQLEAGKLKAVHAIMALQGERVTMKCIVW